MSDQVKKVFEHVEFTIWHVPQANGYVYESSGVELDDDNYQDSPFEHGYEDALNAACELYDIDIGSLGIPLPVVYSNSLFNVYTTPDDEFVFNFVADVDTVPTVTNYEEHPGSFFKTKEEAVIAAFELDLELRNA